MIKKFTTLPEPINHFWQETCHLSTIFKRGRSTHYKPKNGFSKNSISVGIIMFLNF